MAFVGTSLYAIGGTVMELWDLSTPPGALVGATGPRNGIDAGLDYDPVSGALYNLNSTSGGHWLYTIDTGSGAATFVGSGSTTVFGDGLAINSQGQAFATDAIFADGLYSVSLNTGEMTYIGGFGVGDLNYVTGASFDDADTLWMLTDGGQIYTVNTATGAATFVASTPNLTGWEGLAIARSASYVPEPSALVLVMFGALGLTLRRRQA